MSIYIQKRVGPDGEWTDWDTAETVDKAIGTVKQYALGDRAAFRVVQCVFGGNVVEFQWGPFERVVPE